MLNRIVRDKSLWAAFMAAPLFIAVLFVFLPPNTSLAAKSLIVPLLLLIVVYPILEEAVFRGLTQGWLLQWSTGNKCWAEISLANILASLTFVSLHFFYHSPMWAAAVLIPSLVFGFYRDRYRGIMPGTILHCWYNACYYPFYLPDQ